jgi:hypothetical protein
MLNEIENLNITKINVNKLLQMIGFINGIKLIINEYNKIEKVLAYNVNGFALKLLKNSVGGVFEQDLKIYFKTNVFPEYFIYKEDEQNLIIRLISEDELKDFNIKKLVHGKIKDVNYMVLKDFNIKESRNEELLEKTTIEPINDPDPTELLDELISTEHNISLFED